MKIPKIDCLIFILLAFYFYFLIIDEMAPLLYYNYFNNELQKFIKVGMIQLIELQPTHPHT